MYHLLSVDFLCSQMELHFNIGNGIDNKVVMQALRIQMGRHNHLESIAPHLLRQLHADFMCLLWRDLACLKALESVVADYFALVVPLCFGYHHLVPCRRRVAVYARDKKLLLGLVTVGGILHHIAHRLQVGFAVFGVGGLFWVLGVVDRMVEPALYVPDFADRHQPDIFLGTR